MKNNISARMIFDNARALAASLGYDLSQARCTQSYLRGEAALNTTTATYHVPVLVTDQQNGAPRPLEQRLQLQDIFYVSSVFIGWTVASSTAVNGKLYTYPNPVTGATAALNTLYNGKYSVQINNENILPAWDVSRHWFSPRTQENTNFNVAAPTAPAVYTMDQFDGAEDGFCAVEPGWIFNGGANINANVILPGAITAVPANASLVVIHRGILIQNATTVK